MDDPPLPRLTVCAAQCALALLLALLLLSGWRPQPQEAGEPDQAACAAGPARRLSPPQRVGSPAVPLRPRPPAKLVGAPLSALPSYDGARPVALMLTPGAVCNRPLSYARAPHCMRC